MSYVLEYAEAVQDGKILANDYIKAMYSRLADVAIQPGKYHLDLDIANRHIDFIETFCKQSQGVMGEPLRLELFQKAKIEEPEGFEESFADIEEAGIEVTQGEWNGFEDVHMYAFDDEDSIEQRFIVRPEEGVSLAVIVMVDKLDDDEMSMARDDAISAVLDTLSWLG